VAKGRGVKLRLLIDRRLWGRVVIAPDHVAQPGGGGRISGQFESTALVRRPGSLHRAQRLAGWPRPIRPAQCVALSTGSVSASPTKRSTSAPAPTATGWAFQCHRTQAGAAFA
jgi:hypothetical protein